MGGTFSRNTAVAVVPAQQSEGVAVACAQNSASSFSNDLSSACGHYTTKKLSQGYLHHVGGIARLIK